ncbi:hypothetical protein V8C35DRAFT_149161 [Trichoderma chlorosporum]
MAPSTFPHFSRFPPELRLAIWRHSLPNVDEVTMYKYKKGCWGSRDKPKPEANQVLDPLVEDAEDVIDFDFRHEMLDTVPVDVPLAFVNREARDVAMAWNHKRGVEMRFDKHRNCHVFEQRFDPRRDTLFISISKWHDFCLEPSHRLAQPDLSSHTVNSNTELTRIAIPYVGTDYASLTEVFRWFPHLEVLYIVLDIRMDPKIERLMKRGDREGARDYMRYQQWKVEDAQEKTLVWNDEKRNFEWRGGAGMRNTALYRSMKEMARAVRGRLAKRETGSFKIQPVYAIKE